VLGAADVRHGLRVSEACRLTLSQVDLKHHVLHVVRMQHGVSTTHPLEAALAEVPLYNDGEELFPLQVEWLHRWAADHRPGSHRRR
jgi:integrase